MAVAVIRAGQLRLVKFLNMHSILKRQINKYLKEPDELSGNIGELLKAVSLAYEHFDEDRAFMERTMQISTRELNEVNQRLRGNIEAEKTSKLALEKQRLAMINILEDVSESQDELESTYRKLQNKSRQLSALKSLSDELGSVLEVEETIIIINQYLCEFADPCTASYLINDSLEEGALIYSAYLAKEVNEKYLEQSGNYLISYMRDANNEGISGLLKIVSAAKPRIFGKQLDNASRLEPKQIEIFKLAVGERILGLVQITSDSGKVLSGETREMITAIILTATLTIDRLQNINLTHHSRTVSLVESMTDGVVMFNSNADIVLMNPSFSRFTGFSREYFRMADLYRLLSGHNMQEKVQETVSGGEAAKINEAVIGNKTYEIYITPVSDNRRIVGGAIIFHDITYLKEIDRMKTEFVSVASHQLRTPLTAIKLFTDMMIKGQVGGFNPEQQEYLENISQSTDRMVRLVNDLLNVSRIESGRLRVEPQAVDVVAFIKNIIAEAKPLAAYRKQKISLRNPAKDLNRVSLDQNLMRQVFHNLIVNAIRYSPENTGLISVAINSDKESFTVSVQDNGIGIPPQTQGRIFEKFYRADNAIKAVTEGTGLGLYVSRMIVESSGGKIWFESAAGAGSTFFVRMPKSGMKRKTGERGLSIS